MEGKLISLSELSSHKASKNAWVAIQGKGTVFCNIGEGRDLTTAVLDISSYLNEHPGGEEILLDVAGGDATTAFEDVGHSDDAKEAMDSLCIGKLDGYVCGIEHVYTKSLD